jgi:hypothetical protein
VAGRTVAVRWVRFALYCHPTDTHHLRWMNFQIPGPWSLYCSWKEWLKSVETTEHNGVCIQAE